MFATDDDYLMGEPGFLGSGRSLYSMVERLTDQPWYQVLRGRYSDSTRITDKWLVGDLSTLASVLGTDSPAYWVEEVRILSSPSMNKTSEDLMEKVVALFVGDDSNGEYVAIHKLENGKIYSDSRHGLVDPELLKNVVTLYDVNHSFAPPFQD
jgi:hypothetical protein